jgi:hypothetical protein
MSVEDYLTIIGAVFAGVAGLMVWARILFCD